MDQSLVGIRATRAGGRIGSWEEEKLMIPLIEVRGDLTHFRDRVVALAFAVFPLLRRSLSRSLGRDAARRAD